MWASRGRAGRRPLLVLGLLGAGLLATIEPAPGAGRPAAAASTTGPDFRLADPDGRPYSLASFPAGSVVVLYFGYTTCLATCPTALDTIAAAVDGLGPAGAAVRPVFIDIDPDRAAQASLPLYMQAFGPSFLGLTGSAEAVAQALAAFAVKVERVQYSADPTDYAMRHTSPIFILRPGEPEPAATLPATSPPEAIAAAVAEALRATAVRG